MPALRLDDAVVGDALVGDVVFGDVEAGGELQRELVARVGTKLVATGGLICSSLSADSSGGCDDTAA